MVFIIRDSFASPQEADGLAAELAQVHKVRIVNAVDAMRILDRFTMKTIYVGNREAEKAFRERFQFANIVFLGLT